MYLKFNRSIGVFVLLMCAFIGCEHNMDEPKTQTGTGLSYNKILNDVFISCASCHLNGAKAGGLDLSDYENIVNATSNQMPSLMLIKPGVPDSSYLYMKVTGADGITGSRMPPGENLTEEQLDLLRSWILADAPEMASD